MGILLSDKRMREIDDRYCGLDRELSKKIGMPVYQSTGDPVVANREKARAQLENVEEWMADCRFSNDAMGRGAQNFRNSIVATLLKEIE